CSGLTSLAAALAGMAVPRDASMQYEHGQEVAIGQDKLDDVVFFKNEEGCITHVGISNGQGQVIHASGEVRVDVLRDDGLYRHEDDAKSHQVAGIRRWV
ncbi:MAG: NlpC/P60 family protein, partial [Bacteroidota bacterium]|nr:NlpC/P60 family protein [Bacteroidota bacterium]